MKFLELRQTGYDLLKGSGLEIGAFEHPACLPTACSVEYVDRFSTFEAQKLFPEVECSKLIEPDHLIDLDCEGLKFFKSASRDFVIFNHVIEHLINPLFALEEIFRVLRQGGYCVIAAPDKEYTFDKDRPLTPFNVLIEAYESGLSENSAEDYEDILNFIHTEHLGKPKSFIDKCLDSYHARREHLHIWTSESFRLFLVSALSYIKVQSSAVYEVTAVDNSFEYFGVWQKL